MPVIRKVDIPHSSPFADVPVSFLRSATIERKFVRKSLSSRRNHFQLSEGAGGARQAKTPAALPPTLVISTRRAWWNKHFSVIDQHRVSKDRLGGASHESTGLTDVCLITSLRSLGVPVDYTHSGPFRALAHGGPMLKHFGHRLQPKEVHEIGEGKFIVWKSGHFKAVVVSKEVTVIDGDAVDKVASILDLGRLDSMKWFELVSDVGQSTPSDRSGLLVHHIVDISHRRSVASLKRMYVSERPKIREVRRRITNKNPARVPPQAPDQWVGATCLIPK